MLNLKRQKETFLRTRYYITQSDFLSAESIICVNWLAENKSLAAANQFTGEIYCTLFQ